MSLQSKVESKEEKRQINTTCVLFYEEDKEKQRE
jgi:hypothetical protein